MDADRWRRAGQRFHGNERKGLLEFEADEEQEVEACEARSSGRNTHAVSVARGSDVIVIGAGAAGLMAATAARGAVAHDGSPTPPGGPSVLVLDSMARGGLKILASGGGRCNVANETAGPRDFPDAPPQILRGLLRAFPPDSVRRFFESRGVALYAEPLGKLFPVSNRAADVLRCLSGAATAAGAEFLTGVEVEAVAVDGDGYRVAASDGRSFRARRVIVATGGRSLPKTGSRGAGYRIAEQFGHVLDPPVPALAPLHLGTPNPLGGLQGITVPVILTVTEEREAPERLAGRSLRPLARAAGSAVVTHRGLSGPAALDVSGAAARSLARSGRPVLHADFWSLSDRASAFGPFLDLAKPPGACLAPEGTILPADLARFGAALTAASRGEGRRALGRVLAERMPANLVAALLGAAGLDPGARIDGLGRRALRDAWTAVCHAPFRIEGTAGFEKAEVTAGGVRLTDLHRSTLESRRAPGLHFAGEVIAVTGRLGGFNFQWAWTSGFVAGHGVCRPPAS